MAFGVDAQGLRIDRWASTPTSAVERMPVACASFRVRTSRGPSPARRHAAQGAVRRAPVARSVASRALVAVRGICQVDHCPPSDILALSHCPPCSNDLAPTYLLPRASTSCQGPRMMDPRGGSIHGAPSTGHREGTPSLSAFYRANIFILVDPLESMKSTRCGVPPFSALFLVPKIGRRDHRLPFQRWKECHFTVRSPLHSLRALGNGYDDRHD